ncbi:hypothetical protein [Rhodanobacter lindaniclasticus]
MFTGAAGQARRARRRRARDKVRQLRDNGDGTDIYANELSYDDTGARPVAARQRALRGARRCSTVRRC